MPIKELNSVNFIQFIQDFTYVQEKDFLFKTAWFRTVLNLTYRNA